MLAEKPAPQKFGKRSLRELIGVQVSGLLYYAKPLNRRWRSDNPPYAQAWKCHLRKTVNVNDQVRTVKLFQRRDAFLLGMQPRVDVIFHHGNLVPPGQLESFAPRSQRHRRSR